MPTHIVKSGETLGLIAARYGTTVVKLAAVNSLVNPDLIRVGQVLTIPEKEAVPMTEPAHNYLRTTYGGRRVNQRTKDMLTDAHRRLKWSGFVLTQGSYNKGVGASAGTHDGGGVVDISVSGWTAEQRRRAVYSLRQSGFFAWLRTPAQGFSYHIHAVAIGDREMSSAAKSQVVQGFQDRNGLAGRGPDPDPDPYPAWTRKYGTHVSPD